MTSELPASEHMLSKKSITLRRDTFIFRDKPAQLLMGLNQKLTPVTVSTLKRWILLMDPYFEGHDFDLRPVLIEKVGPLLYIATPSGPPVSSESAGLLPAGDYGWFNFEGCKYTPFYSFSEQLWTFESWQNESKTGGVEEDLNHVPELYRASYSGEKDVTHSNKCCFITGMKASPNSQLKVSWIVPPACAPMLPPPTNSTSSFTAQFITCGWHHEEAIYAEFTCISNVGLIREDLISLFHDNAFGVDVDDDYRIVVFRDLESVKLPSRLPRMQSSAGPSDRFLREHFRWCLIMNIYGGDIHEDYTMYDMVKTAEDLGLSGDEDLAPLGDEKWQTPLGKEFLEDYLKTEIGWSQYYASQNTDDGELVSDNPSL